MKAIILAAAVALSGSFAFAGADHDGAWQRNVEENLYKGPQQRITCTEGATQIFSEPRANGLDGMVNVVRTCKDGRWYPKSQVTIRRCTEGATTIVTEHNGFNDRSRSATYVCHNGKYVRAY